MERWRKDRKALRCFALGCNFVAAVYLFFGLRVEALKFGGPPATMLSREQPGILHAALVLLALGFFIQLALEWTREESR